MSDVETATRKVRRWELYTLLAAIWVGIFVLAWVRSPAFPWP